MPACPRCSEDNPRRARFCMACGAELPVADEPREARKTVTVVCAGVPNADALGATLDPESFQALAGRFHGWAVDLLAAEDVSVAAVEPLAVTAVLGLPRSREDDALRAVHAVARLQAALPDLTADTQLRWDTSVALACGVVTGEVLTVEGDAAAPPAGGAVASARRLQRVAGSGEILLDATTRQLVGPAVTVELLAPLAPGTGPAGGECWRLVAVTAAEVPRRHDTPLVDRQEELDVLQRLYAQTVASRSCHLVTVSGVPGVGKSRLVREFAGSLPSAATVLEGRCRNARDGLTYWPLVEVLTEVAGPGPRDATALATRLRRAVGGGVDLAEHAQLLAALVASGGAPASRANLSEALLALIDGISGEHPVVLLLEDLHWATPPLLDLVDELTARLPTSPVLICAIARPELLDGRPAWGRQARSRGIALAALPDGDSRRLVDHLLGGEGAEALRDRVVSTAEGNPLFLGELVRKLLDDGLLARDGAHWVTTADPEAVSLPASISALLTARLDQMDDAERMVLVRASLTGRSFERDAVAALLPDDAVSTLDERLAALVRRGYLDREPSTPSYVVFRFRHQLVREAAYRRLPLSERAELHERCARWLLSARGDITPEEIVGHHLERACRYRVQVGSLDATAVDLAGEAAVRLASAGRRAFGRRDMTAAADLLGRAAGLFLHGGGQRADLLPDLAAALIETGRFGRAAEVLTEAVVTAARLSDVSALERARRVRSVLQRLTRPAEVQPTPPVLDPTAAGLTADWTLMHQVVPAPGVAAGDVTLLLDATPLAEGIARCMQALTRTAENPTGQARCLAVLGGLNAMQGHAGQARELTHSAMTILHDLGLATRAADLGFVVGLVELLARAPARAEEELRGFLRASEAMGHEYAASRLRALLARALHDRGQHEEAYRLAARSERSAAADDFVTLTLARAARARAAAGLGDLAEAVQLAREAVWTCESSDLANLHATALLDLGVVLGAAGHGAESDRVLRHALELFEAKGNRVGATTALRALEPA